MKRVISDTKFPVKVWTSDLEPQAEAQVRNIANLPFVYKHVALMPDAHAGKGSTIGTVIATQGAVLPSAVGVDLGCGMAAVKLPYKIDQIKDLPKLRHSFERSIPVGTNSNTRVTEACALILTELGEINCLSNNEQNRAAHQLGTLGGGNHFIELCYDTNQDVWVMLHSGSRNVGKVIAEKHIEKAKDLMKRYFIDLPDPDLAFFVSKTPEYEAYIHDMLWAQRYAKANREEMLKRVLKDIGFHQHGEFVDYSSCFCVNCLHNFCQMEHHFGSNVLVTRKGAVSAKEGEWGIIPGSMGTKSYIVRGKGNPQSFQSCSHGAGRRMSRTKARELFTKADLEAMTIDVECRKDGGVLDEIPAAYKDIDEVMSNQVDLVDIAYCLKQVLCVKGG